MNPINGVNLGPITQGFDFNYFKKVTISSNSFGKNCDLFIPFSTQGISFLNEDGASIVQVSFNGNAVHDELNPSLLSKSVTYDNRVISKIWFKLTSGSSAVISVRAWAR